MQAKPQADSIMHKELFVEVNLMLAKVREAGQGVVMLIALQAMTPSSEWDLDAAMEGAEEDWEADSAPMPGNERGLDKQMFCESIFELVRSPPLAEA